MSKYGLFINLLTGNATTNDLWEALSKASGKDVNTFMVISPSTDSHRMGMADNVLGSVDQKNWIPSPHSG